MDIQSPLHTSADPAVSDPDLLKLPPRTDLGAVSPDSGVSVGSPTTVQSPIIAQFIFRVSLLQDDIYLTKLLGDQNIHKLSEADFVKWMHQIGPHVERHLKTNSMTKKFFTDFFGLFKTRQAYQRKSTPVFHRIARWTEGVLTSRPRFELLCRDEVEVKFAPECEMSLTDRCKEAHKARFVSLLDMLSPAAMYEPQSAEDLLPIFDYIKSLDYIAWEEKREGCYAKCSIIQEHLLSLNLHPDSICTCIIKSDSLHFRDTDGTVRWEYHQVPGIRLPDGNIYVIDLIFDPEKPMKINQRIVSCHNSKPGSEDTSVIDLRSTPPQTVVKITDEQAFDGHVLLLPAQVRHDVDSSLNPFYYPLSTTDKKSHFERHSELKDSHQNELCAKLGGLSHLFKTMPGIILAV